MRREGTQHPRRHEGACRHKIGMKTGKIETEKRQKKK
jgi:hypothetical protein